MPIEVDEPGIRNSACGAGAKKVIRLLVWVHVRDVDRHSLSTRWRATTKPCCKKTKTLGSVHLRMAGLRRPIVTERPNLDRDRARTSRFLFRRSRSVKNSGPERPVDRRTQG